MVGYDVEVEKRDFEQEGITGTVSRYSTCNLSYPCFIVRPPFEKYKINVLRAMFQRNTDYNEDEGSLAISLYFEQGGQLASMGKIFPRQVNSFLKLFEKNDVTGYYTDGKELTGKYLYVLGG